MSFPSAHHYADSDADDEYERSILTSPMPPTDDETSSIGDSEHGSHEHTPTTFEAVDYGRSSPRAIITEWSTDECATFLNGIGLGQYGRAFRDNEIVGEAIVQLHHDELKEMGVKSMGHRLTILGAIYETKVKQDVDIDADHYVPPSKEEDMKSRQATQEDLSRIIQSLHIRDQRIQDAEERLRRLQDKYDKLREDMLPVIKMAKEKNASLPSPIWPGGAPTTLQRPETEPKGPRVINKKELILNPTPSIYNQSPTFPTDRPTPTESSIPLPAAVTPMPPPEHRDSTYRPATSMGGRRPNATATPSIIETREENSSAPAVEVFKSFRVSMDDPCYKVLPAALKKYSIDADWKQYALYIVYGDQERCLGLEEKPLILFKQLDKEGRKPMFMLRRHVTPEHGFTGHINANANPLSQQLRDGNPSKIALPGGML